MIAQPSRKNAKQFIVLMTMGLLVACGSAPTQSPAPEVNERVAPTAGKPRSTPVGEVAAAVALDQVGVPYRYGGNSTTGFDCSGLVQYAYSRAGKSVPRTTGQQWSSARTVARSELRPGDLLFFSIEGKMSHVGMYVGRNEFVHAPSSGRTVTVARLDSPYYARAFLRAGRP